MRRRTIGLVALVAIALIAGVVLGAAIDYRQTTEFQGPNSKTRMICGVIGDNAIIRAFDNEGKLTLDYVAYGNGDSRLSMVNTRTGNAIEFDNTATGPSLLMKEQGKAVRYTVRGR
jgi:hypothetical protein